MFASTSHQSCTRFRVSSWTQTNSNILNFKAIFHLFFLSQLNQVTSWLDLSQIYNSKKQYFDIVNRDLNNRTKLATNAGQDGGKGYMPACPTATRPQGAPPISCSTCFLSTQRSGAQVSRNLCFIGGKTDNYYIRFYHRKAKTTKIDPKRTKKVYLKQTEIEHQLTIINRLRN